MVKIGTYFDPVVNKTWQKIKTWRQAKQSLFGFALNFGLALMMYIEIRYNAFAPYLDTYYSIVWYAACILAVVFVLNMLANLMMYIKPFVSASLVEMTPAQQKLLAVGETDRGFSVSPQRLANLSHDGNMTFSPGTPAGQSSTPSGQSSYSKTPSPHAGGRLTPTNYGSSSGPINFSSHSLSYSPYSSPSGYDRVQNMSSLSTGASFSHNSFSPGVNVSGYTSSPYMSGYTPSPNVSGFMPNKSVSPGLHYSQLHQSSLDSSGLRSRHAGQMSLLNSPASSSFDRITDEHSLSQYLKEQEEKEMKSALSSPEMSSSAGSSFWSYGRTALDYTHTMRKYVYQVASRSPHSPTTRSNDIDQSSTFGGEDVWLKRNVTEDDLFLWIERLRKWLSQTVVAKLAQEIDRVNATLRRIGSEETEIGEVGISTLNHIISTKGPYVPTLNAVVPYLDVSSNQEYLVKRILELGNDGCLAEYIWKSGGHYGKPWGEHLPTDAGLVMHLFCTYMDSRLPAHPKYPDGKTFTSQHFVKTPDKPNLEKEDTLCIYQTHINPPHFQVVIGKSVLNLPKGRNNMFQAILLFLHHVKTKEYGMLGRVNLGMSGVNSLWIFD